MNITTEQIKSLRDKTGVSISQCRDALVAAGGEMEKALEILRAKSADIAAKKADRVLASGVVASYVHGGALGALLKLQCETDFVARNPEFKALAEDLALHVSAMSPESIPALLEQPFVKTPEQTVASVITSAIQKFGEKIEIGGFQTLSL